MPVVQLFVTCLVDGFAPSVGWATTSVLEGAGQTVEFPASQTCCGQPALNSGLVPDARRMAKRLVRTLDATSGPIVVPSGSCADMITHHVPGLLADTPLGPAALRVARRTRELSQFLADDLGLDDVGASCEGCVGAYHPSCHGMRNLGVREQPERLLDAVAGFERKTPAEADQCCGFGGLFSIEMPAVSNAILESKLDALEETGAEVVVGTDMSCLIHIEGGLRRRGSEMRVMHLAEVLASP
ncbi:MAG: (Fe-S)-binding protein [Acidimicrobiia bacterium]|nr:(Fe-S)-binding protein [Acidimicrobiia bacterium]